ncbi:methyl-accepting chemotaxis protein [Rhizobium sp. NRK18]|uniref:methyl-accepting chemotaxis protein n=1 Tax=Rhizobium sp. NRK18 TaxID=2964667 RepID=UPI0021C38D83|nr:methyl-accepting chemotaxis protein [Rhizobium sp. NRK18]MCQ2006343.1 methyl-accepting chemotaxis protein [Rhizobium sp. NRK18]
MKISRKISLIIALMSLITLSVAGMTFYVVQEYNNKLQAYASASTRAFYGEHFNRLVTAVVMEARGIYASPSTDKATKFAEGLRARLDEMQTVIDEWKPMVPDTEKQSFDNLITRFGEFRTFRSETARLGTEVDPKAANEQGNNEANRANRKAFQAEIDAVVNADTAELSAVTASLETFRSTMMMIVAGVSLFGIAVSAAFGIFFARNHLIRPLEKMTDTLKAVASGDFKVEVPYTDNKDEMGEMARAVDVFKQNGQQIARLNAQEASMREKSGDLQSSMAGVVEAAANGDFSGRITRDYGDEGLNGFAAGINNLVAGFDSGMKETQRVIAHLEKGDLTQNMEGRFSGAFAELQTNLNSALSTLRSTMQDVRRTADAINGNTRELKTAADDLSRRTEQQAASLEETSAALEEITSVVKTSTDRSQEASGMVSETTAFTAKSSSVVRDAIEAMGRIEGASQEISQIINVIDEIAFQTNLLALNAGVEAARAGDAGKGFAVVAQEVRELAQRSATAAKDIKALISKSGTEVKTGVELVQAAGTALTEIETRVRSVNDHIHSIAVAAREQSTGLTEVNVAVNQMDQVTQQNAAMVEETSAATHKLAGETDGLLQLISRFQTGEETRAPANRSASFAPAARHTGSASPAPAARAAAPARPAPARPAVASAGARPAVSQPRNMARQVAAAFNAAPAASADNWEEF